MRSPFPSMDPYLERPKQWGGVHTGLIAAMREILSRQVVPRFFVDGEDGVYVLGPDDPARALIQPGTYIVEAAHAGGSSPSRERIAAPVLPRMPEALEVRTASLAIIDTLDRRVVATLELLSPIQGTGIGRAARLPAQAGTDVPLGHPLDRDRPAARGHAVARYPGPRRLRSGTAQGGDGRGT